MNRMWMVAALALCTATGTWAQTVGIPYVGYLEQDGAAVSGTRDFRFEAFPVATGGTAAWSADVTNVTVAGGRFSTTLNVSASALNSTDLYVQVSVRQGGGGYTLLGRQRVLYTPYAARAEAFSVGSTIAFDQRLGLKLNLWNNEYGLGVENGTLFYRTAGIHRWDLGATSTSAGSEAMRLHVTPTGDRELMLSGNVVQLRLSETDANRNYWLHANAGRLYVLYDSDGNGTWDSPHPFEINGNTITMNGRRLRTQTTVNLHCPSSGNCSASCPSGMVIQQAFLFHGMSPATRFSPLGGTCGRHMDWAGDCIGGTSCSVAAGCPSSGVQLVCVDQ